MRLFSWSGAAITLMIFGAGDGTPETTPSKLLYTEVMPLMSMGGCEITAELARLHLVSSVPGGERVAYVCHSALRASELAEMQEQAEARNAAVGTQSPPQ